MGGQWKSLPKIIRQTDSLAHRSRSFSVDGADYEIRGVAVSADKPHDQFAASVRTARSLARSYQDEAERLMRKLFEIEKEAAKQTSRGVSLELNPPKVKNLKASRPMKLRSLNPSDTSM